MMPSGGTGSCSRLQGGDSWIVMPAKAGVQNLDRSRLSLDSGSRVPRVRNDKPALPLTFRLTRRIYFAPQQRGHRLYGSRERTTKVRPAFSPDTPGHPPITQGHVPTAWRTRVRRWHGRAPLSLTERTTTLVKF